MTPAAAFTATSRQCLAAVACGALAMASAGAAPLAPQARAAIESFVAAAAAGAPGRVTVQAEDPATALPACAQWEPFLPQGAKPWGRTAVGLRCAGERPWTRFLFARVKVEGNFAVAARPIAAGAVLSAADLDTRQGDLTALPRDVALDAAALVGMTASNAVAPGAPLRSGSLQAAVVVRQGQPVRVLVAGESFVATTEGRALTDGVAGRLLQVRTADGRLLSGRLSREGTVTLAP